MKYKEKNIEEQGRIIESFFEDRCKQDEAIKVIQWIKDPSYRILLYQTLRKYWHRSIEKKENQEESVNLKPTLDKIHHRISIDREKEISGLQKSTRIYRTLLRVAAVLILPLLVTSILYINENIKMAEKGNFFTEVSVPQGSKLYTVLPDGTEVWLNSGSSLKYPQSFSNKNRLAMLTGEAYFNVKPDRLHPFVVKTESLDLKVLGTQFNVMAYPVEKFISVTLEKGRISIEKPGLGKKIARLCFLEPNERIVFQKETGESVKTVVNTDQFTSWKDGKLIFRNNSLNYIIKRLGRWYNADIKIVGDGNLPLAPYTLTIEDETIIQVLEYLKVASGISYKVIPAKKLGKEKISPTRYLINNKSFSQ